VANEINKITPFLWFNGNAEEAVDYYLSVFPNSKKSGGLPGEDGKPLTIGFELEGLSFTALNGNRDFPFTNAVSFVVKCKDQTEIDHYWNTFLKDGGKELACGWITDKFGLPWQIVPAEIFHLLKKPKVMQAMMQMKKFVIADLEAAAKE
jgi:predicted 3-demethylubiquinone-9 3-methyltransferase (glyoxalase superfamily)